MLVFVVYVNFTHHCWHNIVFIRISLEFGIGFEYSGREDGYRIELSNQSNVLDFEEMLWSVDCGKRSQRYKNIG